MKKLLLLPIFAIACLFTRIDSFASGIATNAVSAPCDNDTLSKYNGTADVEINWEPNTINLKWFNGEEQVSGQTSCVYDGTITVPPAPTKPGYTFNGWKIPKMNFSTIPTNVTGTNCWAIGWYNNANYCWYDTNTGRAWNVNCNSDSTYTNELQTYEWKVRFEHGDLYGTSGCSTTSGTWGQSGTPVIGTTGQYCWCKAMGYKPNGSNIVNGPLSALSWVFFDDHGSAVACARNCVPYCAFSAVTYSAFRGALFAPATPIESK